MNILKDTDGKKDCGQLCKWNIFEKGCVKPFLEVCPLSNIMSKRTESKPTNNDLISREALLKEVESRIMWGLSYNAIYEAIQIAPAVDAVEVVHAEERKE